jgi:hypothetical protein
MHCFRQQGELAETGRSSASHQAQQGFSPAVERFWKVRVTIHQARSQKLLARILWFQGLQPTDSSGFVAKGFKAPVLDQNGRLLLNSLTRSDQDLNRV